MAEPLLHRLPSTGKYDKKYRVHGHDHLIVEAEFSDEEFRRPELMYWLVRDTRFSLGLDRWRRWQVLVLDRLGDVRSWVQAGGPDLWNPEKRKTDKSWNPIPEGWVPSGSRNAPPRSAKPAASHETEPKLSNYPPFPGDLKGKKYAVVPGWVRSVNDGQRHWIGFGALTWLYGVNPAECIEVKDKQERGWNDELWAHLIWLYPQKRYKDYESMKEELAKGEDAFKLIEP